MDILIYESLPASLIISFAQVPRSAVTLKQYGHFRLSVNILKILSKNHLFTRA